MKLFSNNGAKKSKPPFSSLLMYAGGVVIFLIAIASLVMNVLLFQKTVAQYVDQGYPSDAVLKELVPVQLIPGLFESIALYAGIAFILVAVGFLNHKISKYILVPAEAIEAAESEDNIDTNSVHADDTNSIEPVPSSVELDPDSQAEEPK